MRCGTSFEPAEGESECPAWQDCAESRASCADWCAAWCANCAAEASAETNAGSGSDDDLLLTKGPQAGGPAEQASWSLSNRDVLANRYVISRLLGAGTFGLVYLASDLDLQRPVAIKVPRPERLYRPQSVERYLAEARIVANLRHPNIVPIHDMGKIGDGGVFLVSSFIDGETLKDRIQRGPIPPRQVAAWVASIAEALDHAHSSRLIHRDVKPANILIEAATQTPFVTDFGLAAMVDDRTLCFGRVGTPAYTCPEVARGEGHRLDRRSDIFSLGVTMYELLTRKRPFRGGSDEEIYYRIIHETPTPPHLLNPEVSPELERVCLKALAKRASDRYATAKEMAEDLRLCVCETSTTVTPTPIVFKGLRSFDGEDADFFLDLLPGPWDRLGIPESITWWKKQIEQQDPEQTFGVGMIYGPSGSGKSSFVKAGLIPLLAPNIIPVYIEATGEDTELRLRNALTKRLGRRIDTQGLADFREAGIPQGDSLTATLSLLRRGAGLAEDSKVVLIIDQFEQWLHANRQDVDTALTQALRQCDGAKLQAIVMVRADFALAASRFMRFLETPIVEGHNFSTVDFFGVAHAERVLTRFGQALGRLPAEAERMTPDQLAFVKQAARGLSRHGEVVSVRIAVFSEMVKHKEWTPATLDEVGGTEGIGINYLEETFGGKAANPSHREHRIAAQNVLVALLPEVDTDIRGEMRSVDDLLIASGYQDKPREFAQLLSILDGDLKLITPTEPEGLDSSASSERPKKFYQLTHDYLVPSLRAWLGRVRLETRRGQAEMRLAERAKLWTAKSEHRQLPSLTEYLRIRLLTSPKRWSSGERAMMGAAGRFFGVRLSLFSFLAMSMLFASAVVLRGQQQRLDNERIASLFTANLGDFEGVARNLGDQPARVKDKLAAIAEGKAAPIGEAIAIVDFQKESWRAAYVLANQGAKYVKQLVEHAISSNADPQMVALVATRVRPYAYRRRGQPRASAADEAAEGEAAEVEPEGATNPFTEILWTAVQDAESDLAKRLRSAAILAMADPDSDRWPLFAPQLVEALLAANPFELAEWINLLKPVAPQFRHLLRDVVVDEQATSDVRSQAARAIADCDDGPALASLMMNVEPSLAALLFRGIESSSEAAVEEVFLRAIGSALMPSSSDVPGYTSRQQAHAALGLAKLNRCDELRDVLAKLDNPTVRTLFIVHAKDLEVPAEYLQAAYEIFAPPTPDTARQAILLALSFYNPRGMTERTRNWWLATLERLYRESPHASERSAAEYALRRHGLSVPRPPAPAYLDSHPEPAGDWSIHVSGQVLRRLRLPMISGELSADGTPATPSTNDAAARHAIRVIDMSVHEVTVRDVQILSEGKWDYDPVFVESDDAAAPYASLIEAMRFCRWLGEQEHLDESEQVYPAIERISIEQLNLTPEQLKKPGFRLPTAQEWQFACAAGSETPFFVGEDPAYLNHFAWYGRNCDKVMNVGTRVPNAWGFFDMMGNVAEWCHPQDPGLFGALYLGSGYRSQQDHLRTLGSKEWTADLDAEFSFVGFRVVRTVATEP